MKLLIAGFDGLDLYFFEETELPHMAALRERAQWGALLVEVPSTPQAWTTIMTGWRAETHKLTGYAVRGEGVWFGTRPHDYMFDELGRAGISMGVLNVPALPIARAIKGGWMVVGWPYKPRVWPGTLEIPENYYTDVHDFCQRTMPERNPRPESKHYLNHMTWNYQAITPEEYREFAWANQKVRIEVAVNAPPVDVLMLQCSVVDRTGHYGNHRQFKNKDKQPALRRALELVDWSLGEMIERFQPENIAIVSDHGFWGNAHTHRGTWAVAGPDVLPMRLDTGIENFMPTMLDLLGVEVERDGTSVLVRNGDS